MLGSLKGMLLLFLSSPLLNDSREKGLTFGRGRRRRRPRLQEVEASRRHEDYVSFEGPIPFKGKKKPPTSTKSAPSSGRTLSRGASESTRPFRARTPTTLRRRRKRRCRERIETRSAPAQNWTAFDEFFAVFYETRVCDSHCCACGDYVDNSNMIKLPSKSGFQSTSVIYYIII